MPGEYMVVSILWLSHCVKDANDQVRFLNTAKIFIYAFDLIFNPLIQENLCVITIYEDAIQFYTLNEKNSAEFRSYL